MDLSPLLPIGAMRVITRALILSTGFILACEGASRAGAGIRNAPGFESAPIYLPSFGNVAVLRLMPER